MVLAHLLDFEADFLVLHLNDIVGDKALLLAQLVFAFSVEAEEAHGEDHSVLKVLAVLELYGVADDSLLCCVGDLDTTKGSSFISELTGSSGSNRHSEQSQCRPS